jgi:hypothetical protein
VVACSVMMPDSAAVMRGPKASVVATRPESEAVCVCRVDWVEVKDD